MTEPVAIGAAKQTIRDAVIAQLREDILSGGIAPGTKLRQHDIATRFDVSTTPVREAFSALEREGLVIAAAHRGVIVFEPTAEYLHEVYDIRFALETLAVRKAVENVTESQLREMTALLSEMSSILDDRDGYHGLNARFHDMVYSASGSPRLVDLIKHLRDSVNAYLRLYARQADTGVHVHQDHLDIVAALRARDADAAVEALTRHLRRTVEFVSEHLPVAVAPVPQGQLHDQAHLG